MDDEEMQALRDELDELMDFVGELNGTIGTLDSVLTPFYERKRMIDSQIARTHEWISAFDAKARDWRMGRHGEDVVVGWRRQGAEKRHGLFAELNRLMVIYGGTRSERIGLSKDRRAAERAAKHIRAVLGREQKRRMTRKAA